MGTDSTDRAMVLVPLSWTGPCRGTGINGR